MTETHKVKNLAEIISNITGAEIEFVPNPRKEANENELLVKNDSLLKLGLNPITLESGLLEEIRDIANNYSDRCDKSKIPCTSLWTKSQKEGKPIIN